MARAILGLLVVGMFTLTGYYAFATLRSEPVSTCPCKAHDHGSCCSENGGKCCQESGGTCCHDKESAEKSCQENGGKCCQENGGKCSHDKEETTSK